MEKQGGKNGEGKGKEGERGRVGERERNSREIGGDK